MPRVTLLAALMFAAMGVSSASAGTINFELDSFGIKPNGFTSLDSPIVHFTDTVGAGLTIDFFNSQGLGTRSLGIRDDVDGGFLEMNFDVYMMHLGLWFGNDDPGFTSQGDLAVLTLFDGLTQIAQVTVELNRNDLMDQSISYTGLAFNRATFAYTNAALDPHTQGTLTGLTEIVDNITFTEFTETPEPATMITWGAVTGVGLAIGAWRRRKNAA